MFHRIKASGHKLFENFLGGRRSFGRAGHCAACSRSILSGYGTQCPRPGVTSPGGGLWRHSQAAVPALRAAVEQLINTISRYGGGGYGRLWRVNPGLALQPEHRARLANSVESVLTTPPLSGFATCGPSLG